MPALRTIPNPEQAAQSVRNDPVADKKPELPVIKLSESSPKQPPS